MINSGNMLFPTPPPPGELETAAINARTVVQATRTMGGKTMGIGNLDLAAGITLLQSVHQPPDFSLLSANLVAPAATTPIFAPVSWATAGDLQVAIIALTDHQGLATAEEFRVLPWEDVLEPVLATIASKADFILLLSNYPMAENQSIARRFDRIDCILQAGHVLGNKMPIIIKNTLISQTDIRGKYLGVLDIQWNGHGRWKEAVSPGAESDDSTYSNRFIALKMSLRNDPEVEAIVKQAQRTIAKTKK